MLKKIVALIFILAFFSFLVICTGNTSDAGTNQSKEQTGATVALSPSKILVVYFSHSGSTREIAKQIHEKIGGDLIELQPATPYPSNYLTLVLQAREERQAGIKPPLKTKIENIKDYDQIYLGFPIWGETIPAPITTFLAEYDLTDKTIIPFCTHGGWGPGQSVAAITERSPRSTIREILAIEGKNVKTAQNEIAQWLQKSIDLRAK